jgi:hypothetical protein
MNKEGRKLLLTKDETTAICFSLVKSINEIESDHKQKKKGYTGEGIEKEIQELEKLKEKIRKHLIEFTE